MQQVSPFSVITDFQNNYAAASLDEFLNYIDGNIIELPSTANQVSSNNDTVEDNSSGATTRKAGGGRKRKAKNTATKSKKKAATK